MGCCGTPLVGRIGAVPELSVPEGVGYWSAGGMCWGDPPDSPPSSRQDM